MLPSMVSVLTLSPRDNPITLPQAIHLFVAPSAPSPLTVRICADIHRLDPPDPIVFVVRGALAEVLPSIAFAQRTAHRTVAGYVLIDPVFPNPAADWPDAPVMVLGSTQFAERDARLRGWQFQHTTTDQDVSSCVQRFVEDVTLT